MTATRRSESAVQHSNGSHGLLPAHEGPGEQFLESFLQPLAPSRFVAEIWEKQPYLAARNDSSFYSSLVTIADVDALIQLPAYDHDVRVVKTEGTGIVGRPLSQRADGSTDIYDLYRAHHDGYTIVVDGMERRWQPVADLCRRIESAIHHRVKANLYFTPRRSQGFAAHYDTHDVFVLQLEGSKRWRLYDAVPLPLADDHRTLARNEIGEMKQEIQLEAGDLLYLPRGHIHEALSSDENPSLHLTIGIYASRWIDLVQEALLVAAHDTLALREALSVGFLNGEASQEAMRDHLLMLLNGLNQASHADLAVRRFTERRFADGGPMPDGHFSSIDRLHAMSLETVVEQRPDLACSAFLQDGMAIIRFRGNMVTGPAQVEQAFRFVARTKRFAVRDLPGLSDSAQLVLVRRLVKEGLLTVV